MDDLRSADAAGAMSAACETRHALVIFNPVAGWRRRRRLAATLRLLGEVGIDCRLVRTGARGDAEALARAAADAMPPPALVIAAGGDGTINEVANGLLQGASPPPLEIGRAHV